MNNNFLNAQQSTNDFLCQIVQTILDFDCQKAANNFPEVKQVVFAGMGGSGLSAHIIRSIFGVTAKIPLQIINDYSLPGFVNQKTLVIITSYSGNTEETLAVLKEAKKRRAQIFVICSGGKLADLARRLKVPNFIFIPTYNQAGVPNLGIGYSLAAQILLLDSLKIINCSAKLIAQECAQVFKQQKNLAVLAKKLSSTAAGRQLILVGGGLLAGNLHAAANYLNEVAKNFANYFILPEINHHLLEGMINPAKTVKKMGIIFFLSKKYSPVIRHRATLTKKVFVQQGLSVWEIDLSQNGILAEQLAWLQFSLYFSLYSAQQNGVDPLALPWVSYFKRRLSK